MSTRDLDVGELEYNFPVLGCFTVRDKSILLLFVDRELIPSNSETNSVNI